jgi:hypothetical protein
METFTITICDCFLESLFRAGTVSYKIAKEIVEKE